MKKYFTYGIQANDRDLVTSVTKVSGVNKRYFSSLDAEVYFGGERILDIARIDFSYEEKVVPIYGFNSFIPSRMIRGQKLITGTFIINFTEVGYMVNLLNKLPESSIANEFDKIGITCNDGNEPMFKKSFDIVIGYGGYRNNEESLNATFQVIQGAYITGYQQMLDVSGEPIAEVYSFMARNIVTKETTNGNYESDNNTSNSQSQDKNEKPNYTYEVLFTTNENDINALKDKSQKDNNLLGLICNVYIEKVSRTEVTINMKITHKMNMSKGDKIGNVKVTISDTAINLSKTYTLAETDDKTLWSYRVSTDSDDIVALKRAVLKEKPVAGSVEFSLFREATASSFKINQQTKINVHSCV